MNHPTGRVFLIDEQVWADVMWRGAHISKVYYSIGGIGYTVIVENDEFIFETEINNEEESLDGV